MRQTICCMLLALCLLTGCAPLLERTYSVSEPHSSKFWESEAAGTLRAENHQDIVNDLLLLIGQHRETATLRLYNFESDLSVADTLERAAAEIQQETPMGAYAVEYITSSSQAQRGYYEAAVRISYRRSLEQIQSVVNATSPEALYSLLAAALADGQTELAVRMGYWGETGLTRLEESMALLREEQGLTETPAWVVNFYPNPEEPGLVEFLLDPPELPEEDGEGENPEDGEEPEGEEAPGGEQEPKGEKEPEGKKEPTGEQEPGGEEEPEGEEEPGGEQENGDSPMPSDTPEGNIADKKI